MHKRIALTNYARICVTLTAIPLLTALIASARPVWAGTAPLLELAQASQLQNFQPGYPPPLPAQNGSQQTLTLPPVAPQSSYPPALEIPPARGQTGTLELPVQPRAQAGVARISITVTDDSGGWVPDLRKQDLTIYENGVRRPILALQRDTNTPASIGIVVDTSGSMEWKLPAAEAALRHFVNTLNPRDDVFLMAFSGRAYLLQDFTSDPAALDHAITILHAYGQTALFDAIVQGLVKVEQGRWPKRALLVMTDGMDNASTYTLPDVIAAARRAGVLIYTVGLGVSNISNASNTPFFGGFGFGFGRRLLAAQQEEVDASTLRTLSEDTGGTTFVLNPRVTNLSELDAHFQAISAELREQYTVLFSSSGGSGPQPIKVEATRPGLDVRAPKWADAGAYSASR
ncbi:MAG TPA: VWA domain-containing protein [Candidatus Binataceae bacterium]|nr:VWA domain-containing protein [Candidatus Binataceae bacterium]